ncbi:Hypothetical protein CINCED_3A016110 [Cinara cedri]|uniref:Uncharacterized protein n=1 Tax=Cinara cedri TaxID=506608 RepID=A0A5E4NGN2_9HEMI|nr:Hypothetical protein CINCED_3A016110 [Cinara cedri]
MNRYSFQLPFVMDATLENRQETKICGKSELTLILNDLCDDLNSKNNTMFTERMNKLYPLLDKECCLRNNCGELFMSFFCPYLRGDDSTTEEPRSTTE